MRDEAVIQRGLRKPLRSFDGSRNYCVSAFSEPTAWTASSKPLLADPPFGLLKDSRKVDLPTISRGNAVNFGPTRVFSTEGQTY